MKNYIIDIAKATANKLRMTPPLERDDGDINLLSYANGLINDKVDTKDTESYNSILYDTVISSLSTLKEILNSDEITLKETENEMVELEPSSLVSSAITMEDVFNFIAENIENSSQLSDSNKNNLFSEQIEYYKKCLNLILILLYYQRKEEISIKLMIKLIREKILSTDEKAL